MRAIDQLPIKCSREEGDESESSKLMIGVFVIISSYGLRMEELGMMVLQS